jgi:AcrR family transcriptional regulator
MLRTLTDRQNGSEDKRRLILDAAVHVFARNGFHASRVADIAEEAGIAHGLLYHYFRSKDDVLECVFKETWSDVVAAVQRVEVTPEPARERLAGIAKILLRAWRRDPDLVRVVVREIVRTPELQARIGTIGEAFGAIERIIAHAQEYGEFRSDIDPKLATFVFYGALDEILTGWVLGTLDQGDEEIARAERTVVEIVCGGLAADRAAATV